MNNTKISWTMHTWNPVTGCNVASEGCAFCYAKTIAENKRGTIAFPNGFDITIRRHKLNEPKKLKGNALIFVNSMSDLFLESIHDSFRDEVFDIIENTPQHTYQILTKRAEIMKKYFEKRKVPKNAWIGVTVESKKHIDRINIIRTIKADIKFLSIEPMLSDMKDVDFSGINQVIGGGESGLHLYKKEIREKRGLADYIDKKWIPMQTKIWYAQSLRDSVKKIGAAFFWKQWGGARPDSAGSLIDGEEWKELPA